MHRLIKKTLQILFTILFGYVYGENNEKKYNNHLFIGNFYLGLYN